ncbi:nucleotidyltransferase family protein [Psychrobacter frigidicola]|uniref:Nucleotidyltransferase family protein n=1 Tax=Psychrobacter frigidicola TaxID=45611 RepID=A0A5C7ACC5_9GAMM|nr:nucleotidyltransferase family protein [Psychrobacter frigidicola]TXD98463.1 nucleotidyltransferase family protein [Psychrobacter frigidicola]
MTNKSILSAAILEQGTIESHAEDEVVNHAVIILASGLSQRLGQSKQLLSKNGEALICYMTMLALSTQPKTIIVVVPKNRPKISNALSDLSRRNSMIDIVVNPIPEVGMAHSLYLGIEALTGFDRSLNDTLSSTPINRVLIMGVDQVLLDSHHLTNLLAGTETVIASSYQHLNEQYLNKQDLDEPSLDKVACTEKSKGSIIGLPIVISYELLKQWQSALIGDKGLRYLIRALPSNQLSTVNNPQLSYDIDTPHQLTHAQQQRWLDS